MQQKVAYQEGSNMWGRRKGNVIRNPSITHFFLKKGDLQYICKMLTNQRDKCLHVCQFDHFLLFSVQKKKSWGGIITFSGANITKWDQRLGKKCQTVVRTQMSGQSGRKCVFRRVKEHQNHLKRGQGRIVQGDSTQQALCEWNTRRSYSSRCCLLGDV